MSTLLQARGTQRTLPAQIIGACFDLSGEACGFALGDGALHVTQGGQFHEIAAHEGAILALAPDTRPRSFLTGGDDGAFRRIGADGSAATLFAGGGKWIEQVTSFAEPRGGLLACAAGKQAHLFSADGTALKTLTHPTTVTGLAFDAKGKRIAASHYNGASLWFVAARTDTPRVLEWKGSHTAVAIHPAGEAVVTAMQENALHGWRLSDGQHMRMSGYPAKSDSIAFTRGGKYLASSGADTIVLWPFFGGGPMGKPPLEIAQIEGLLVTRIACHPKDDLVAAGYADGTVVVAQIATARVVVIAEASGAAVTALAWNAAGGLLAFGTEAGHAAVVDLSAR